MTLDIKDFYLNTPMKRSEYMRLKLSNLPKYFIKQYKLNAKTTKDGYVHKNLQRNARTTTIWNTTTTITRATPK